MAKRRDEVPRPDWCRDRCCDRVTRLVECMRPDGTTYMYRCPRCHPLVVVPLDAELVHA